MINSEAIIKNLKINYIKQGYGKPVLIVPGWGTTIATYQMIIDSVSQYSCVYCLDMPGCGNSQSLTEAWNSDQYVDFIIEFIHKLKLTNLNLIGHSNGGRIVIKLANRKLDFNIDKIVLTGSSGIFFKKPFNIRFKIFIYKFFKKIFVFKCLKKCLNHFGSEDYKNASPVMKETMKKLISEDLTDFLPNITQPTLLIWGENDTATPISTAKIMESKIPNSSLFLVKNCSHYVFLEKPYYVHKIIHTFFNEEKNNV